MISKADQANHAKHLADKSSELVNRWKAHIASRDDLSEDMDKLITDIRNFAAYVPDEDLDESLVKLAKSLEDMSKCLHD